MLRKRIFVCLALVVACNLWAEEEDQSDKKSESVSEKQGEVFLGAGVNIGVQKTSSSINSEFRDRSSSVNSTAYGGTVAIGYYHNIGKRFFIGIEAGADFGSGSKQMRTGGMLRAESSYVQSEFVKRDILRQMMHETANAFDTGLEAVGIGEHAAVVAPNVWRDFLSILHYIGGEDVNIRNNFTINPSAPGGLYDGGYNQNLNATLGNIMANSRERITVLGNGDLFVGFGEIRRFLTERCAVCAAAFRNFAEQDLRDLLNNPIPGTSFAGANPLNDVALFVLSSFFRGTMQQLNKLENVGINPANMNGYAFADLQAAMNSIYTPTADDDSALALPRGVNAATIRNNLETKASFEVCPHVAFKVGYSFEELGASLYVKLGAMQLKGRVTPVNDIFGMGDEKFNKVTPFAAVGVTRNLDDRWGVSVEVSHAFRTTKRLPDVKIFRYTIENRTSISRTGVKVMAVYRIRGGLF
ncbi:MAG: hypothetical protein LBJ96_03710 [Holosporaceae bacterium]|nr:hypothetical protein [Holosporaceae bacterium]